MTDDKPEPCNCKVDFVSMPGLPHKQPELNTDHSYALVSCIPLFDQLQRCMPAVKVLENHEDNLHSGGVCGNGRHFLPKLEKCILDLVRSGACQGVLCGTFFGPADGDHMVGRIIESGCLQGVSADAEVNRVLEEMFSARVLRYQVFSEEDLIYDSRKRKRSGACEQIGQKYRRSISRIEEPLKRLKALSHPGGYLRSCVLLLLRKNSKANKPEHRFFKAFGETDRDWQLLEAVLQNFRTRGNLCRPGTHLADLKDDATLQEQLDAISTIGNTIGGIPRIVGKGIVNSQPHWHYPYSFITSKKISGGRHLPLSLRNRLLHFVLENDVMEIRKLLPNLHQKCLQLEPAVESVEACSSQGASSLQQPKTAFTGLTTRRRQTITALS